VVQDTVECQADQLPERKLALAALTLSAVIRNADLVEPQGSDGAAQVGLIVLEFLQLIENAPIDQAEV
jgi:hypothetical protein